MQLVQAVADGPLHVAQALLHGVHWPLLAAYVPAGQDATHWPVTGLSRSGASHAVQVTASPAHCAHVPEHGTHWLALVLYEPLGHAVTQVAPLRYGRPDVVLLQAVHACAPAPKHMPHVGEQATHWVPSE